MHCLDCRKSCTEYERSQAVAHLYAAALPSQGLRLGVPDRSAGRGSFTSGVPTNLPDFGLGCPMRRSSKSVSGSRTLRSLQPLFQAMHTDCEESVLYLDDSTKKHSTIA